MAQMITLEEAAEKLGISPEEMKKKLKTDPDFKRLSQIRDGANIRFKLTAIEELARQQGMASDEGLPMKPVEDESHGSDDFKVESPDDKKKAKKQDDSSPLEFGSTEDDVFSLSDEPKEKPSDKPQKATAKLGYSKPASGTSSKGMSDSSSGMEGSSDSDVRLDGTQPKDKKDEGGVPTEEIALDFSGPGSAVIKGGSSAKLSAPKSSGKLSASDSGKNKSAPPPPDSSEFELSLDADSDDFEMQMNPEGGDEVDLGTMPKEKGASPSSGRSSKSGINLRDPADGGIVLDQGSKAEAEKTEGDSEPDFELSLDSSSAVSSTKLGAPKSGKMVLDADSDSEFELTLDDSGGSSIEHAALDSAADESADKGDIFETDFEIPPMPDESASEAVALESDTDLEKSDFVTDESDVLVEDGSESEVVLLGDEDEAAPSSKSLKGKPKAKPAATESAEVEVEVADEDDGSASKALKGVKGRKRRADGEDEDEEEEAVSPAATIVERPTKPWGVLPALFLVPAFVLVFVGALVGFETLHTLTSYQQPTKPASPIVRGIASTFDMELKDQ